MIKEMKETIKKYLKKRTVVIPIIKGVDSGKMLDGRVALITGGTGGIGIAIAKKYLESGAKVIIAGTNKSRVDATSEKLGLNCGGIVLDVTKTESFPKKIDEAAKIFGRIDILVCSHGVHTEGAGLDFFKYSDKEYARVMDINLKGTYFVCQSFAKYLIDVKVERGNILLISSSTALEPAWSPYRLSKLGVSGLTKGLAQSLLNYNIIVNSIAPGSTATKMLDYHEGDSIATDLNPNGRYTVPEEIAEYAAILVSGLGDTVVGDTIYMSGGRGVIDMR